jgi:hypothetical protein
MAGLVGSLAMLLEWSRLGVTVDLDRLPRPPDVAMKDWLTCFPAYGFLLCVPQGREADCLAPFHARGLDATVVGMIDKSGLLALRSGEVEVTVLHEPHVLQESCSPARDIPRRRSWRIGEWVYAMKWPWPRSRAADTAARSVTRTISSVRMRSSSSCGGTEIWVDISLTPSNLLRRPLGQQSSRVSSFRSVSPAAGR